MKYSNNYMPNLKSMTAMFRLGLAVFVSLSAISLNLVGSQPVYAACAPLSEAYGTVTSTITVPTTGDYRVWSRIMAADATANSFYLEIDGTTCGVVVGDNAGISSSAWTWVDYKDGTTTSKIDVTLTAGTHTVKMIGREANVKVDRLILTADTSCVPTGTGENCANPPDTTNPIVSLTAPISGATISGASVAVSATATDDIAVQRVEFFTDSSVTPFATDTTASGSAYSVTLNSTSLSVGSHTIRARAYDAASNYTDSVAVTVNVNDTVAPTVSVTAPANGATITGSTVISANASDAIGVVRVEFFIDGQLTNTDTTSPYSYTQNTTALTNGSHAITATVYDAAGNYSSSGGVTVTVNNVIPDTTKPTVSTTAPTNGSTVSGTVSVTTTAADNIGVTLVEFYIDGLLVGTDTTSPYSYSLNTGTLINGSHTVFSRAYDAASNTEQSSTLTFTVNNTYFSGDINQDHTVNIMDFQLFKNKYGQTGASLGRADIDGNSVVNIMDFQLFKNDYGKSN